MPFPIVAALGALGAIGSSAINAGSQASANRANIALAEKQNQWNLEQWHRQNEYNDPSAQMERLKKAGLNPNLVYGKGATHQAGSVHPAQRAQVNPVKVENFGPVLSQYTDLALKQAQIDNVEAQTENTRVKTENESLRKILNELDIDTSELDLERKTKRFTDYEADANKIQLEQERSKLSNILQDLKTKKSIKYGIDLDNEFKKNKNELAKMGVYQSDNMLFRFLAKLSAQMGLDLGDLLKQLPKQSKIRIRD